MSGRFASLGSTDPSSGCGSGRLGLELLAAVVPISVEVVGRRGNTLAIGATTHVPLKEAIPARRYNALRAIGELHYVMIGYAIASC